MSVKPTPNAFSGAKLLARVRSKGLEVIGIEVLDLSLAGCMIHTNGWALREEQRLSLTLPDIANLHGKVLWIENGWAGLLFDKMLNEADYYHLIVRYAFESEKYRRIIIYHPF